MLVNEPTLSMTDSDVLTVGCVSRICKVSARTATQWIDRGLLKGFRIPGSNHRRVLCADLKSFLASKGMPEIKDLI